MPDAMMPAALADSLAGRRLAFFIDRLRDGGNALTDDALMGHWVCELPAPPAPVRRMLLSHFGRALGAFAVRDYDELRRPDFALAFVVDERARAWRLWVQLEATPPHRIHMSLATLAPPPGITLRPALPEDAAALRALERSCAIQMGDVRVSYDRGEDYFAGARLVGESDPMVAERDGSIVAVHCVLVHELRVDGRSCRALYLHHTRILPGAQGGGLFSALQGAEMERNAHRSETIYSYVAVGNEAALKTVPVPNWSVRPERLVIDCRACAGAPFGRPATTNDAERIVALVNVTHQREELFVPYTIEALAARLGREPATYGWGHLLVGEQAVAGVWPAGLRVLRQDRDGSEESVRALVLDYGFAPGAEDELIALLRAWCGTLAARGFTHLTLFTSPGSPGRDALRSLAARSEQYHFNIGLPEPADVGTRGIYVDQMFF